MPYTTVNTLFDAGFPRSALNYWKANFLAALTDETNRGLATMPPGLDLTGVHRHR